MSDRQHLGSVGPTWNPTTAQKPSRTVIDAHTHLMVPASKDLAMPYFEPHMDPRTEFSPKDTLEYNAAMWENLAERFQEPEARIADMDKQGIDIQVLSIAPPQYYYWLDPEVAVRSSRVQHERFAEIVRQFPTRFAAIGNIPMNHPELAVEIMEEAKRDFGFNGVEINGDVNGGDLDDPRYYPVWEKAIELDMSIVLHPHGFTHGQRMNDYYLVNVICLPLATTVALSRMILGGVWERFPDLRMLAVHGGGYLPFYFARTDHAFDVRPELRKHIDRLPSDYLRMLYFDTTVFEPKMVEYLVEEFGEDRVLMGSDYPFDMGPTDPLGFLSGARLTDSARDAITGGNAARFFKIDC